MGAAIEKFLQSTGIYKLFTMDNALTTCKYILMYVIIGALFYLAIVKKFEPLLLAPIAFGMLLANLPGADIFHMDMFFDEHYFAFVMTEDGGYTIEGVLSGHMTNFLNELDAIANTIIVEPGAEAIKLYEVVFAENSVAGDLGTLVCNFSTFTDSEGVLDPVITKALSDCFDGAVHLKNSLIQVDLGTMVKEVFNNGGFIDLLYIGVKTGLYPSLIFLGIGAMTDFTALIANPKSLLLGAAAQLGVFVAFLGAILLGFDCLEAASIGIIGGADGPTAILVTKTLAPALLGAIAIAAYSYMALIPMIQPPIMRLLTTKEQRKIEMTNLRPVSRTEKILFPVIVAFIVCIIIPDATPLIGCLMLGNLFNVSGVCDRLSKTAQNELINIVTIMLGVSVGATAGAENFLSLDTIKIIALGLTAFGISTAGGLLFGRFMCFVTKGKINPLIGSAGVSAVPMAARVAQVEGQKNNPRNFLLMHAMGPNVAGVIGSAVAAGVLLSTFG